MVRSFSIVPAVATTSLLLGPAYAGWGGPHHHQLTRNPEIVRTFDHKVLGNLQGGVELANLEVPRSHVFSTHIEVGTPGQELICLLDIGSADVWVPSKRCKDCQEEHLFSTDASKTFMPAVVQAATGIEAVPVRASFPDGDILGFLVQDTIAFAGADVAWKNQSFIIVEDEAILQKRHWDGLCGLGFRALSDAGTPLYKNMPPGERAIFSLIPNILGGHLTTYLSIGEMPHNSYEADSLAWAPANPLSPGSKLAFWVVSGGLRAEGYSLTRARYLLDSSTAYILAPRKYYRDVMGSFFKETSFESACGADRTAGNLVVCDCQATLDSAAMADAKMTMVIGGKDFTLTTYQLFKRVPAANGRELCLLMVQQSPPAEEVVIDPLALLAGVLGGQPVGPPGSPPPNGGDGGGFPMAPFLIPANMPPPPPPPQFQQSRRLQEEMVIEEGPMEDVWVLGGVFLEQFVVILDFEERRLGLAISTNLPIVGDPQNLVGGTLPPPGVTHGLPTGAGPDRSPAGNVPLGWQEKQAERQAAEWQAQQHQHEQAALEKQLNEMHREEEEALRARDFLSNLPGSDSQNSQNSNNYRSPSQPWAPSTSLPMRMVEASGGSTLGASIRGFVIMTCLSTAIFIGLFQLWRKTQTRKNIVRPPLDEYPAEEEEDPQFALAE